MKKVLKALLTALICIGLGLAFNKVDAMAGTIHYVNPDGSHIQNGAMEDITTDTLATPNSFAEVIAALGAGNIIGYVHPEFYGRALYTPSDAGVSDGMGVVVITKTNVTASGKLGTNGVAWFIYDNTLYLISTQKTGSVMSNESTKPYYGDYNRVISYSDDGFDKTVPVMEKGDLETDGYGMTKTAVNDERVLDQNEYYDAYQPSSDEYRHLSIGSRGDITLNDMVYSKPSVADSVLDAGNLPWINYAGSIEKVVFGTDIRVIGSIAQLFNGKTTDDDGNRYLAVLFVHDSDTNRTYEVGPSLYTELTSVEIYSDFSGVTSMAATFARCSKLKNVIAFDPATGRPLTSFALPALNTAAYMFYGDTELENSAQGSLVNIMDLTSGTLVNASYMFAGCESIATPHVSTYNMSNAKNIDGMFQGAKNAQISFDGGDASVKDWDVGNVVTAMYTFAGVLPDPDTPTKKISPALDEIPDNQVVSGVADLTQWDLGMCVSTYFMFASNLGVTSAKIDDSYASLKDAAGMFNGCDNMNTVDMANSNMPELLYGHAMFRRAGSKSGGTADLSGWTAPKLMATDFMFQKSGYTEIGFDNTSDMSNLKEAVAMFADCKALRNLGTQGLSKFKLDSVLDTSYMFDNDIALVSLQTGGWGMGNVENMSHMFCNTAALGSLDTEAWTAGSGDSDGDGDYLSDMECFAYWSDIDEISMENWDTSHVENMYMAFAECENLTSVALPKKANSFNSVEDVNGMFYNDPELMSVGGDDPSNYSAPALRDARGMFTNDNKLISVDMSELVGSNTTNISYMFRNCSSLTGIDISGWDTSAVKFMQGIFDGCGKLADITPGTSLSAAALETMAIAFRNCHVLPSSALNAVLGKLSASSKLVSMYQAFKNCYALTSLDMSAMDLSKCIDFIHLAYMEEDASTPTNKLVKIIVPSTMLTADGVIMTDTTDGNGNSINMFWVDGDGAPDGNHNEGSEDDDLLTAFYVNGTVPARLLAYNFGGVNGDNDNRSFIEYLGKSINGEDIGTYTFTDESDTAVLKMEATSSFYKDGVDDTSAIKIPLTFEWKKNTSDLPGNADTYTTEPNAGGVYDAACSLSGFTGSNTSHAVTFELVSATIYPKSIDATYKGSDIYVGEQYSREDVEVIYHKSNGTTETLDVNKFTVDSVDVTKVGENTYTVSYDPGDGVLTDTITVTGKKSGTPFISAVFDGDPVEMNKNYNKSDVIVTYTDRDGLSIQVPQANFTVNSQTITKLGDNTFTASYTPAGSSTALTDTFVVPGLLDKMVLSATYKGDKIPINSEYNKNNVEAIVTLKDGSKLILDTKDFLVDSLKVTKVGENTFTASYTPEGSTEKLTDTFTVTGIVDSMPITATYKGEKIPIGSKYSKSDVEVIATLEDGTKKTLTSDEFTVDSQEVNKVGENTFTASYTPVGSAKAVTDTFVVPGITGKVTLSAEYTGDSVPVGSEYLKSDVKVILTLEGGDKVALTTDDFIVDSQKVTKYGDNTFTATYLTEDGPVKATFTVSGKRLIGSIKAEYSGTAVLVGSEYNTSDVAVTAYYSDDTAKVEGFRVTPTSFSSTKVTRAGDNSYTVSYVDPDQNKKVFTAKFKVNGYKNVSSIAADYTGDKVKVGKSYNKNNVKVTLYYEDGTSGSTENFTVDSKVIRGEGDNSYTATYRDPYGNTYTAGFSVPGYKDDDDKKSSSSSMYGYGYYPGYPGSEYAGVSSVYPGTGYATSVPVNTGVVGGALGALGVSSGIVQTGTTLKSVLYAAAGITLVLMLGGALYMRFKKDEKERNER